MKTLGPSFSVALLAALSVTGLCAQERLLSVGPSRTDALRLYLDCSSCWESHIRSELTYVNYVRDPADAQVHLLITTEPTGSGGKEYTLVMIGRERFERADDTLRFALSETATEEERRTMLLRYLKIGLMRYVARTPMAELLEVSYRSSASGTFAEPKDDPWDSWVFAAGLIGNISGETSSNSISLSGNLSAERVTSEWKTELLATLGYSENNFRIDPATTISGISRSYGASGLVVRSLGDHWSTGGIFSASSSTYGNAARTLIAAPALEYNLFPYHESTRRQFRILYRLNLISALYREETIFDRTEEVLLSQSLFAGLESRQTWGSIAVSLNGSHYFHDISKYQTDLTGRFDVRVVQGLSLTLLANVALIRDQLALPKAGATQTQILLRQQQLATNFSYSTSFGLNYRFGSIFNNVVNPRFE